ncbi:hypothetical protein [Nonlabens xiamenensis]|uniref:hypothetical protein n=1 Tax=Nonlabens xiamenensis TaxID=2341043 RepID=UPI000F6135E9|nr:hypothetical protein [Nonlabens xiamenensis]
MYLTSTTTSSLLWQWSTGMVISSILLAVLVISAGVWLYKHRNGSDGGSTISVKVDRNGKYHYDLIPDSENGNLLVWIKIILAIIALAIILLPFKHIVSRP